MPSVVGQLTKGAAFDVLVDADSVGGDGGANTLPNNTVAESNVTQHQGAIDHDALTNFAAGEHRSINDAGTSATELWSASKINTELASKGDVSGPGSSTDHSFMRANGATGKVVQDSGNSTLSDAGVATLDDGAGNQVVITPHATIPKIAMLGDTLFEYQSANSLLELSKAGVTVGLPGGSAAAPLFLIPLGAEPSAPFTNDIYLDNGTNTASGVAGWRRYTGSAWVDVSAGSPLLTNVKTRSEGFCYVTPVASTEFFLGVIPVAATATECYAICENGTSVVFTIVSRARSAPFSGGTNIVNAQTATTTGGTKTIASSTLAADNELWISFGTVTGSVDTLRVTLKHTVDA